MQIVFTATESWSSDRASIVLYAKADSRLIKCIVSQEFLTSPSVEVLGERQALELFHRRRDEIEQLLREHIQAEAADSNNEIILRP
jgi:hypothetical protein